VYVPTDFHGLTDIEADAEGGVVVTEGNHTPPRRTARFAADGNLLREWFGAQHYGVIVCPEPNDPRHVWFMANADRQALVRCEVDYAKKTWRVVEIYQDVFEKNPFARVPAIPTLFAHQGRIYIQGGGVQPGGLTLSIYDPVKKQLRPCNASGSRNQRNYLWNDLNDDGLASDDEVEWLSRNQLGGYVNPDDLLLVTPMSIRPVISPRIPGRATLISTRSTLPAAIEAGFATNPRPGWWKYQRGDRRTEDLWTKPDGSRDRAPSGLSEECGHWNQTDLPTPTRNAA